MAARSSKSLFSCRRAISRDWPKSASASSTASVLVEEDLCAQPVELGIDVVRVLALGSRETESERAQGLVVAADLPEAIGEQSEEPGRSDPAADLRQLDQRLLHLRDARLALPRFDPRTASKILPRSHEQRKPERLGETHELAGEFPRPVGLAALEMDESRMEESIRQTERMFHALRQRHRRLAQSQRPVGMAKVEVTPGRDTRGR